MKKKVKKIPKFAEGFDWLNAAEITAAATKPVANALGIEQGKVSEIGNAIGDVAGLIPGVGPFISAGVKTLANFAGGAGGTDGMGNATKASGLTRWFGLGRSDNSVLQQANREKNAINAKTQTQHLLADYYNNQNVPTGGTILAAEGGIMRKPVDALVSPGEIAIDPYTLEYKQFGSDNEEPNSKDNIKTVLKTGDIVKSHAKHMKMPNGKTPADNSKMVLDSNMPDEMKRKMIKKINNWESAHRTKPQEYAMFDEGTGKVKARKKEKINYVVWNNKFGYFDAEGGFHDMSDVANPNLPDSTYLGRYEYVDAPVQDSNTKSANVTYPTGAKYPMDPVVIPQVDWNDAVNPTFSPTVYNTRNTASDNKSVVKSKSSITKSPTQDEINAFYGYDRDEVVATERKDRNKRINKKNKKYITDEDLNGGELDEVVVTAPRINKATSGKNDGKKSSSGNTTAAAPKEVKPVEINQTGLDWARLEAAKTMSQYAPNTTRAVAPGLVSPKIDPTEIVEEAALPSSGTAAANGSTGSGSNGSDWKDNLYRMAVLSQPLWDRAKAESVDYTSPVYKYMPTAVDVSSQLRDADQSYALARYNFANLYPNTGAGMAAGLQAASNRAKQYADIRQYQTNAQNELIGKNVGIYNNWANEHARILNDVYNKSAQNRAAARNINRQNRAAALSNWGTMLSDDKKMTMDKLKLNMLEPMLQYGYLNYDGYLKWKKSNGYE